LHMMAIVAMERAALDASDIGVKAKAMGLLQAHAARGGWEPEARKRAQEAATAIQNSMKPCSRRGRVATLKRKPRTVSR
jgi:hypothetical protein